MTTTKHTLPVHLSRAQKAVLEELSAKSGLAMCEMVRRALKDYVTVKAKRPWPASPLLSRGKKARKPPIIIPVVDPTGPLEHLRILRDTIAGVVQRPETMGPSAMGLMEAHYRAAKARLPGPLRKDWAAMNHHRAAIEQGTPLPAEVDPHGMLVALWHFERLRKPYRTSVDRSKLSPAALERVRASDRRRSKRHGELLRAKAEERLRQAHEDFCQDVNVAS
jgi:hypothetical protein